MFWANFLPHNFANEAKDTHINDTQTDNTTTLERKGRIMMFTQQCIK